EPGVILLRLLAGTTDHIARAIRSRIKETHLVAYPLAPLGAADRRFPVDTDTEGMAFLGCKEGGLAPEGIFVDIFLEKRCVVTPPEVADFGHPLPRDADQVSGAVGRVVHRWKAVAPGTITRAIEVEGLQAGVMILGFRVEQMAELSFAEPLAGADDRRVIPA